MTMSSSSLHAVEIVGRSLLPYFLSHLIHSPRHSDAAPLSLILGTCITVSSFGRCDSKMVPTSHLSNFIDHNTDFIFIQTMNTISLGVFGLPQKPPFRALSLELRPLHMIKVCVPVRSIYPKAVQTRLHIRSSIWMHRVRDTVDQIHRKTDRLCPPTGRNTLVAGHASCHFHDYVVHSL
ncbi:hypothetical protein Plhal304r1_c031g0100801 [Plasmopara halstedii]